MLRLHETEEIKIGDITPYDDVSKEEKRKMGRKAMSNGAKTVADIFIECDTPIYEGNEIFTDMIKFLKDYSVKK